MDGQALVRGGETMIVTTRYSGSEFDSRLQVLSAGGAICALTLVLRLRLIRLDHKPAEDAAKPYQTRPWTNAEWANFVFRYRTIVERFWNNRFWLKPPVHFSDLDFATALASAKYRPNVECRLSLELVPNSGAPVHREIRVVCLTDTSPEMTSNAYFYDSRDVRLQRIADPKGRIHPHITAVHEVGHLLLGWDDHPGEGKYPECDFDPNARICYGNSKRETSDVLGYGLTFYDRHASPWRRRMGTHTNTPTSDWTVLRRFEPPELVVE